MNILEIVFGYSCYHTIKNSKLNINKILMINTLFNVGDISNIKEYEIRIPKELCLDKMNSNLEDSTKTIIDSINKKYKIRVWTSRQDVYSYLMMLFVSSVIKKYDYELYTIYSDDYNEKWLSPSMLREEELEKMVNYEQKLSLKEINDNAVIFDKLVCENSELRVLKNNEVKSVSIDYYDTFILNNLSKFGKIKMFEFVGKLMSEIYLQDILYVYLINRLIEKNKIKIYFDDNVRYFENIIEIT